MNLGIYIYIYIYIAMNAINTADTNTADTNNDNNDNIDNNENNDINEQKQIFMNKVITYKYYNVKPNYEPGSIQEQWAKEAHEINTTIDENVRIERYKKLIDYVKNLQSKNIYNAIRNEINDFNNKFNSQNNKVEPTRSIKYNLDFIFFPSYKSILAPGFEFTSNLNMIELKLENTTKDDTYSNKNVLQDNITIISSINTELSNIIKKYDYIKVIITKYNDSFLIRNRINIINKNPYDKKEKEDDFKKIKNFYNEVLNEIDSKIDPKLNIEELNEMNEEYIDTKSNVVRLNAFNNMKSVDENEFNTIKTEQNADTNRRYMDLVARQERDRLHNSSTPKSKNFNHGFTTGATAAAAAAAALSLAGGSKKNKRNKQNKTLRKKNTRRTKRSQKKTLKRK